MTDPHAASTELAYLSLDELWGRMDARQLTSTQLIDTLLERIHALDDAGTPTQLNSVAALAHDAHDVALERDDERAKGLLRGPLHGIPVLIKDNIEAIGLPGLAGSTSLVARPARDAPLVTRLREAGAIIVGQHQPQSVANIRSPRSTSGYSSSAGLVGNPWPSTAPRAAPRPVRERRWPRASPRRRGGPRPTGPSPVPRPSTAWSASSPRWARSDQVRRADQRQPGQPRTDGPFG